MICSYYVEMKFFLNKYIYEIKFCSYLVGLKRYLDWMGENVYPRDMEWFFNS